MIRFTRGTRYLGGFIGSDSLKQQWLEESCAKWAAAVRTLAKLAPKWPQTAYAGLTMVLQNKWQYVQRVVRDAGSHFAPVEMAIRDAFLPALLGVPKDAISGQFRELLSITVKQGGLGVRNPVENAAHVYDTSAGAAGHLVESMLDLSLEFNVGEHNHKVRRRCQHGRNERDLSDEAVRTAWGANSPPDQRRMDRARKTGAFLTAIPNRANGTALSAEEFRDNIRLRYNLAPLEMPQRCDGCGAKMTVEHALSCRVGGLVHIRHDDVADEYRALCVAAFSPSRVQREPRIHSGVCTRVRVEADGDAGVTPAATPQSTQPRNPYTTPPAQTEVNEDRGDASCYAFWQRGRDCIFDVRITDTEAPSHRNKDPAKVLEAQEKAKKAKYLRQCHENRKDFTPLVYSVDGMAGREARNAEKRLGHHLAVKWKRPKSQVTGFVRVRMSLAIARANSLLLRGSRDRRHPVRARVSDGTALRHAWDTWQEQW